MKSLMFQALLLFLNWLHGPISKKQALSGMLTLHLPFSKDDIALKITQWCKRQVIIRNITVTNKNPTAIM